MKPEPVKKILGSGAGQKGTGSATLAVICMVNASKIQFAYTCLKCPNKQSN